ncbi:RTA1 like protein [Pyrenophora tritici-repentis]|nr:RTA1 like protein [Pyrenophora tritici-repentis]
MAAPLWPRQNPPSSPTFDFKMYRYTPSLAAAILCVVAFGSSIMGTMQLSLAIAGSKIVIAGLALQVATFLVFLTAALDFQWRMLRKQTTSASTVEKGPPVWRKTLYVLYGVIHSPDFNSPSFEWLVPSFQTSIGDFTPLDHHLLQYYKANVWRGFVISGDTIVKTLHRDIVPRLSISHPFLLYAILSIAATHSNLQSPDPEVERQSLLYRQKTFKCYQSALKDITAENYEAVLVTGTFLLALVPPPVSDQDSEYLDWILALLKLSEGLRVLASLRWGQGIEKLSVYPLVRRELRTLPPPPLIVVPMEKAGVVAPIGPLGTTPVNPNPAPTYTHTQLPQQTRLFLPPPLMELLQGVLQTSCSGPVDWHGMTLLPVFHALSPIFTSLYYHHLNPDFYVRIFVFTSFLMPDFLKLVGDREPRALVLVAWWFALADLVPKGWWVGDKVTKIVGAIGRAVRMGDHELAEKAFKGAQVIVDTFEREGRDEAAKSVFEGWNGVDWEEGPKRAAEWEIKQLIDLDDFSMEKYLDVENCGS